MRRSCLAEAPLARAARPPPPHPIPRRSFGDMKLKELHALMQGVAPFKKAKVELEQYPTGAHLASQMLFMIDNSFDELDGRLVVDLGCGTGMLSIGASLLGAAHVIGVDVDGAALETAAENVAEFGDCGGDDGNGLPIDFVMADVTALLGGSGDHCSGGVPRGLRGCVDTVLMNPPFGTKKKGVDMEFLAAAFQISRGVVYSLHKSSTRSHIQRLAERQLRAASAEVLAELRYDLPATMKFHKHKSVDIEVDLWRFEVPRAAAGDDGADGFEA